MTLNGDDCRTYIQPKKSAWSFLHSELTVRILPPPEGNNEGLIMKLHNVFMEHELPVTKTIFLYSFVRLCIRQCF